jgi:divalent anion:Na+ symporter, DASS family
MPHSRAHLGHLPPLRHVSLQIPFGDRELHRTKLQTRPLRLDEPVIVFSARRGISLRLSSIHLLSVCWLLPPSANIPTLGVEPESRSSAEHSAAPYNAWRVAGRFAVLILVYALVAYVIPRPAGIKPEGWRLTGLFIATIGGLLLEPIPGAAVVLLSVVLAAPLGGLSLDQALAGYSDRTTWLVLAAFFLSRALIKTGLARRIALFFVRAFGKSSLGVSYSLAMSDIVLAGMIPSNGARVGGVILPIARSLSEIYGSSPGPTAQVLGTFLMTGVYQSACLSSAMFYTGQASNPLAARMAAGFGYQVTWLSWFKAALVPGAVSLLVMPWLVMKLNRPVVTRTPEASAFARRELNAMGPLRAPERILSLVFVAVCGLWMSSSWTGIDITLTALLGGLTLILTGVLTWEDMLRERIAWDIFIWYGGLVRLGTALNDTGVPTAFARSVTGAFSHLSLVALFTLALLIYFYAHYAFASITTHMLSMFPAFLAVLLTRGVPLGLTVFAFAIFANLAAGLTHYGTTPGPMIYAHGYTPLKRWWLTGFTLSLANLAIFCTIGFAWWKWLGIW